MDIKRVFKERNITIVNLAEALGCSTVRAGAILESNNLGVDTLRKVAKALGCSITDFFYD